jgi:hypothetical protein
MHRYNFEVIIVIESDLVGEQSWFSCFAKWGIVIGQFVYLDRSIINSTHTGEVFVTWGECEGGDFDLVVLPALEEYVVVEVPEVDFGFESHLALLACCNLTT